MGNLRRVQWRIQIWWETSIMTQQEGVSPLKVDNLGLRTTVQ